jgi:hypothetical protein
VIGRAEIPGTSYGWASYLQGSVGLDEVVWRDVKSAGRGALLLRPPAWSEHGVGNLSPESACAGVIVLNRMDAERTARLGRAKTVGTRVEEGERRMIRLVELRGLEPLTLCLQSRCSSS